jgi:predicted amidohydrolase YtcJ
MKPRLTLVWAMALLLAHVVPAAIAMEGRDLVLQGAKVYPSPTAKPIENAVVLIHDGRIVSVGTRTGSTKSAQVIDCTGKVIVAGFWNSHVHFETGWQAIAQVPAGQVEAHLQEMLTRWVLRPSGTLALILAIRWRFDSESNPEKSPGRRF